MNWWDKLMGRGRRGHFLRLPTEKPRMALPDGCPHCGGLPLIAANAIDWAVRVVGYEHAPDCQVLRAYEAKHVDH